MAVKVRNKTAANHKKEAGYRSGFSLFVRRTIIIFLSGAAGGMVSTCAVKGNGRGHD
jgi:hypothetical protein